MMVDLFSPFFTVGKCVVTGGRTTRQHVTCNEEGVRNLAVSPLAPNSGEGWTGRFAKEARGGGDADLYLGLQSCHQYNVLFR